jgi:predicted dehydrogenase
MSNPKTAGIIGFGAAGHEHYWAYKEAGLEVLIFDASQDVEHPAFDHPDRAPLADILRCDVVSICCPDDSHMAYAMEATGHMLIEKPLTHKLWELDLLAERIIHSDKVIECHFPLRHNPFFTEVVESAKNGKLGEIVTIDMTYHYGRPERMRGWRGQIEDYSLIAGGGIHLVDLACQIAGYEYESKGSVGTSPNERTVFWLGDVVCSLATDCFKHVPHTQVMVVTGTTDKMSIHNPAPVDKQAGVHAFLDKVRTGKPGNTIEAIAVNRICIEVAS